MSCDTNDKSIDLPSSITFTTPTVALIEEDDIIEETRCEADEQMKKEKEVVCEANGECHEEPEVTATRQELEGVPAPKLSITMPSSHVVEISQSFYWPLYTKPIDWLYQAHVSETCNETELEQRVRRVAEELQSMTFFQVQQSTSDVESEKENHELDSDGIAAVMRELQEVKEDWFNDLSGGQKSKVELVRKVFLHERCPEVVLIDETLAPLDPTSKTLVMSKLKDFCQGSIVIVIYHADTGHGQADEEGGTVECVPSSNFFDQNIHLENQMIRLRPIC
jgi:hypothetical protein